MEADEERLPGILRLILREAELKRRSLPPAPADELNEESAGSGVVRLVWDELRLRLRKMLTKLLAEEPRRESTERASLWERFELLFLSAKLAADKPRERPLAPGIAGAR